MAELDSLPYLDAVVKEGLRMHPAIPGTMRVAEKDDIIPLEKHFVDTRGRVQHTIR